ncbi:hypothetical protein ACLBYF_34080 [Methylobacterium brachiatum]
MTILMSVALALAVLGALVTHSAYRFAPVTNKFAGWGVAFVSGISVTALGSLGALLLVFTA